MCVPKAEKEEHEAEEHAPIVCPDCAFTAIKGKYAGHPDTCPMRPRDCEFCSKPIQNVEKDSHYKLCGSKTQKCETCGDFVKLMDKASHKRDNVCA